MHVAGLSIFGPREDGTPLTYDDVERVMGALHLGRWRDAFGLTADWDRVPDDVLTIGIGSPIDELDEAASS